METLRDRLAQLALLSSSGLRTTTASLLFLMTAQFSWGQVLWERFSPGFYEIQPEVRGLVPTARNGVGRLVHYDIFPNHLYTGIAKMDSTGKAVPYFAFDSNQAHPWNFRRQVCRTAAVHQDSIYVGGHHEGNAFWGGFGTGFNQVSDDSTLMQEISHVFSSDQELALLGRPPLDTNAPGTDFFFFPVSGLGDTNTAVFHHVPQQGNLRDAIRLDNGGYIVLRSLVGTPVQLLALDAQGNRIWSLQGSNWGMGSLAPGPEGSFYLSGTNQLARIDSLGNPLWAVSFAGDSIETQSLAPALDGGVLVGGSTNHYRPYGDPMAMKVDASGQVVWAKTYPSTPQIFIPNYSFREVEALLQVQDGSIYVSTYNLYYDPVWQFYTPGLGLIHTDSSGNSCLDTTLQVTSIPASLPLSPFSGDVQSTRTLYSNANFAPPFVFFPGMDTMDLVCETACPLSSPLDLGPDRELCPGDSLVLDAGSGFLQYNWSNGDSSSTLVANQPGAYFVEVLDSNGCSFRDTAWVDTLPQPSATFTFQTNGDTVEFQWSGVGANAWLWTFGDGDSSQGAQTNHVYLPGTYLACLWVENAQGCSDSLCQSLTLLSRPTEMVRRWTVYPQPARTALTIEFEGLSSFEWALFDPLGIPVRSGNANQLSRATLALAGLPAGSYLLRVTTPEGIGTRRIVIAP